MRHRRRPFPKTRATGYRYACPEGTSFDESAMETALAAAKRLGLVTEYDTGRGHIVWFNGPPGQGLREVRARARVRVIALLPKGYTSR